MWAVDYYLTGNICVILLVSLACLYFSVVREVEYHQYFLSNIIKLCVLIITLNFIVLIVMESIAFFNVTEYYYYGK